MSRVNYLFIALLSVLSLVACNNFKCAKQFEKQLPILEKARSNIYMNFDTIFYKQRINEFNEYAGVFWDEKDSKLCTSVTDTKNKTIECMLTKRRELFMQCYAADGFVVSEIYSFAYLPNDTLSSETKKHFDIENIKKLPKANWYLVSWISGID